MTPGNGRPRVQRCGSNRYRSAWQVVPIDARDALVCVRGHLAQAPARRRFSQSSDVSSCLSGFGASAPCATRQRGPVVGTETVGAGEGNRTLVISLEGCCSTIELHPRRNPASLTSSIGSDRFLIPLDTAEREPGAVPKGSPRARNLAGIPRRQDPQMHRLARQSRKDGHGNPGADACRYIPRRRSVGRRVRWSRPSAQQRRQ